MLVLCKGAFAEQKPLRVLHLTFHQGCAKEIDAVAKKLGFEVETWFVPNLPPLFFDGTSRGNALYNIGHERAENIWKIHQPTFEKFDVILTSDTAPLARIFLQNNWKKPLIIWVCNRFDYADTQSLDCHFPDPEFYQLFNDAQNKENVKVVAYTLFEHEYAKLKKVNTGSLVITPCAPNAKLLAFDSSIPSKVNKKETFFLPPYTNEEFYLKKCEELGISVYRGRYNGPGDLRDFKGIIHFPYALSNLAFFENISEGIPYFVPSVSFLKTLLREEKYWFMNAWYLMQKDDFEVSEWYQPGREEIITYFDSWEDLQYKIAITDFPALRNRITKYAEDYRLTMLKKWTELFTSFEDAFHE